MKAPPHVLLRAVDTSDLPTLYAHQQDPIAVHMAGVPGRAWDAFVAHWNTTVLGNPACRTCAIVVDNAVVGHVCAWDGEGQRFVGYWIARSHWGQGITTVALSRFLAGEATRPLHALVHVHNVASMRVLEKVGFLKVTSSAHDDDTAQFRLDAIEH